MTNSERGLLMLCSQLLEYPEADLFQKLPEILEDVRNAKVENPDDIEGLQELVTWLATLQLMEAQEHYVRVFDHDPGASLYLSWHRYGNDRGQGKAMAALNGLYRAAGYEPEPGSLPDYLPRMLEFLAVCDDWAAQVLLDGFGPELSGLQKHLEESASPYASLLKAALSPLRKKWPAFMQPRTKPDRTLRPMARPEMESPLFDSLPEKRMPD